MKHISLFSGIGGFNLACDCLGIPTIANCEIDVFCQKVLKRHWPDVPIVKDVNNVEEIKRIATNSKSLDGKRCNTLRQEQAEQSGRCDRLLLTAGFPCQPFSAAGRRKGSDDSRYLWPQTLAVIEGVKPDWVLLENVAGILSMVFPDSGVGVASQASLFNTPNDEIADYDTISGRIDRDLRQAGYETVWFVIPACAVNAPHRRDRVWIVAHLPRAGLANRPPNDRGQEQESVNRRNLRNYITTGIESEDVANPDSQRGGASEYGLDLDRQEKDKGQAGQSRPEHNGHNGTIAKPQGRESREQTKSEGREDISGGDSEGGDVANANPERLQRSEQPSTYCSGFRQCESSESVTQCDRVPAGWSENWYEVAQRFCVLDDGFSSGLGGCLTKPETHGIMGLISLLRRFHYADAKEARAREILRVLREAFAQENYQWAFGRFSDFYTPEELQCPVHGSRDDENTSKSISLESKSREVQGERVREVWSNEETPHSSQGWAYRQQCTCEFDDIVCELSSKIALGEWENRAQEVEKTLFDLCKTNGGKGLLYEPLSALHEIWQSLTDKEIGAFRRHYLRRNEHRVEKLKSLGNAIVPSVAYQIIKAIAEADLEASLL